VSGYSKSLQLDGEHFAADVPLAIVMSVATVAFALWSTRDAPTLRRIGVAAIVLVAIFTLAKQGFVRHDYGHVDLFAGGIAAAWLALPVTDRMARAVCAVGVAAIALAWLPMAHHVRTSLQPKLAITQLVDLLVPGQRSDAEESSRVAAQAAYGVDPTVIERIGDASVDVRPWETGLVWAYDLGWHPLPVTQDYQAYTPHLDQLNADALVAADGPEFVLRHLAYDDGRLGIDRHFAPFDAPAETRAMLCEREEVITSGFYELLGRSPERCGPERPLESVSAAYGEAVPVPSAKPGEAVFARIDNAGGGAIEGLRAAAYRGAIRTVELDGTEYRLLPLTAADGLLISAPPNADYPGGFALAPNASTITVGSEGGIATSDGPLAIEFSAVPVEPAG
jgi:hypothetical protein